MAHPVIRPLPYLASSPAPLEVADDETTDPAAGGALVAATGVAAPAVTPSRAWDLCTRAFAPERVRYCRDLAELAVWVVVIVWIARRVLEGRGGDALNALARSKAPH